MFGACAETPGSTDTDPGAGGKADGSLTTVTFADDFSQAADGPLYAGTSVRIAYDLDRLSECRGSTNGSDVWGVTGWAQFDGGEPKSFALSRIANGHTMPVRAELQLPSSARHLAMWFTINNRWGCNAYDSNNGANYAFDVAPHGNTAVLAYDADGTESQSDAIAAGDKVVIHYAPERLAQCAGSTGGHAAWSVTGYWQVDSGSVHQLMVTRSQGADLIAADPMITVPQGRDLALWFEATSVWGCHAYDSDFGANYHATIN